MKAEWLDYLCDPIDGGALRLTDATMDGDRISKGWLVNETGNRYPVVDGIPSFITDQTQSTDSVKSFAYEWEQFGFLYAREGWLRDIVAPLAGGTEFFRDKVVIDAGAGSGAQSRWIAEAGAKFVFSLELSDCIYNRHRQSILGLEDRIFPIQCDITRPPLRIRPDVIYCCNVLQHVANPEKAFQRLSSLAGENTEFLFNIYTRRSESTFRLVRAARRVIRVFPFPVWKWGAFCITAVAYPLAQIESLAPFVRRVLPISHSFKETWLDVYDAYGGHYYQENMTLADQTRLIREAGMEIAVQGSFGYRIHRKARIEMPESTG